VSCACRSVYQPRDKHNGKEEKYANGNPYSDGMAGCFHGAHCALLFHASPGQYMTSLGFPFAKATASARVAK
jgi:hypothetical protein